VLDSKLLEILCCPETRQSLTLASADVLAQVNAKISAGDFKNRAGRAVSFAIAEALLSQDGKRLYPVVDGIPVMLIDESILLNP